MNEEWFLVAGLAIGAWLSYMFLKNKLKKEEQNRITLAKSLAGTYLEGLAPFMKECKYDPRDMHHMGKPIDYIVFNRNLDDSVKEVVFLEVKTGKAELSFREDSLKKCIENKQVRFEEMRF